MRRRKREKKKEREMNEKKKKGKEERKRNEREEREKKKGKILNFVEGGLRRVFLFLSFLLLLNFSSPLSLFFLFSFSLLSRLETEKNQKKEKQ